MDTDSANSACFAWPCHVKCGCQQERNNLRRPRCAYFNSFGLVLQPTNPDRPGWVINPFVNEWWCVFAAILPAMLATILIFMDQQITAVIVNRKENKLRKGAGYHLDLLLIAIQVRCAESRPQSSNTRSALV